MNRSLQIVFWAVGAVGGVGNAGGVVQAAVGEPPGSSKGRVGRRWAAVAPSTGCPRGPAAAAPSTALALALVALCLSRLLPPAWEESMFDPLKRHAVKVLLGAGHTQAEVSRITGVSVRSVRRIAKEPTVTDTDASAERRKRRVGRPSKAEPFREFVRSLLEAEPRLMTLEVLRRARLRGYDGGKSAMYRLVADVRAHDPALQMRFEGLPGEFSQHDFGQVDVRFIDGARRRVKFFASRLKWSRWAEVTLVDNERAETLIRTLLDHFVAFGGVPLCAVFDRPKTVALQWRKDGTVTRWNPVFAFAATEIGFVPEVCWPYSPRQKGSVEKLVGWVKGSFFKQRRFHDLDDLRSQLQEWLHDVNEHRPCAATGVIPAKRRAEELPRLRPPRVLPDDLALVIPTGVGPTGYVIHDTHQYSMPPAAANLPATLYLYRDRVRIVAGRHEAEHVRRTGRREVATLPEHRAQQLAFISGKRGRRYLRRQHILELGGPAGTYLTELVHQDPAGWYAKVDELHDLLQRHGGDPLLRAFRASLDVGIVSVAYIRRCLEGEPPVQLQLLRGEVS